MVLLTHRGGRVIPQHPVLHIFGKWKGPVAVSPGPGCESQRGGKTNGPRTSFSQENRHLLQDGGEDGHARLQPERPGGRGLLLLRRPVRAVPGPHPDRGRGEDAEVRDGRLPRTLDVALGRRRDRRQRRPSEPALHHRGRGEHLRRRARPGRRPRLHAQQVPRARAARRQDRRGDGLRPGGRVHGCRETGHGHGPAPAHRQRPARRTDPRQAGGARAGGRLPATSSGRSKSTSTRAAPARAARASASTWSARATPR